MTYLYDRILEFLRILTDFLWIFTQHFYDYYIITKTIKCGGNFFKIYMLAFLIFADIGSIIYTKFGSIYKVDSFHGACTFLEGHFFCLKIVCWSSDNIMKVFSSKQRFHDFDFVYIYTAKYWFLPGKINYFRIG